MELNEKCGVFGVFGRGLDAARLTFFGLYALQHRGQESSGIAATDGVKLESHAGMGLVSQAFTEADIARLLGHAAIGHNRYSTSGGSLEEHSQPIMTDGIALAHNGNLPSVTLLADFLTAHGVAPGRLSDSSIIARSLGVLVSEGRDIEDAVREIFPLMTGAFSILILTRDKLIALRDQYGIRPLSIGRLNSGYVFASETCAFNPVGAEYLWDVSPGEMVVADARGLRRIPLATPIPKLDIFEFVYFARPDSTLLGHSVYEVRKNFGIELARAYAVQADVVVPVPETAIPTAIGFSQESGIPMETGIIKNRYIHRTFIQPEQHIREQGVKLKLTPLPGVLKGKRVVVIDDSIVRGTTSRQIVHMLYDAGATEVHFCLGSSPVAFPDFYGIDTPSQKHLLAASKSVAEMREYLGATSLNFLPYEAMIRAIGVPESMLCTSCFTGVYPIDLKERTAEVTVHNPPALSQTVTSSVSLAPHQTHIR